jgi:hypothetical protein
VVSDAGKEGANSAQLRRENVRVSLLSIGFLSFFGTQQGKPQICLAIGRKPDTVWLPLLRPKMMKLPTVGQCCAVVAVAMYYALSTNLPGRGLLGMACIITMLVCGFRAGLGALVWLIRADEALGLKRQFATHNGPRSIIVTDEQACEAHRMGLLSDKALVEIVTGNAIGRTI